MSRPQKNGVLGGTFDPIHSGHLILAEQAMSVLSLDRVIFMPTGNPPHKVQSKLTPAFDRTEMVRLATCGNPAFSVSTIEIDTPGTSYTYNTLTELKSRLNQEDELYYIVGSDVLLFLNKFYNFDLLADICTFVVVTRAGVGAALEKNNSDCESPAGITSLVGELERAYGARFMVLPFPEIDISSTMIREKLAIGDSVRYMLPDSVLEYIRKKNLFFAKTAATVNTALHGYWESAPKMPQKKAVTDITADVFTDVDIDVGKDIYVEDNMNIGIDIDAIRDDLRKRLSPGRFAHTLNVMEAAAKIAKTYGENPLKAEIAGLLHDCARSFAASELIKICDTGGETAVSRLEIENPVLLHGKAGFRLAEKRYGITDVEILRAIEYHTTGSADMNVLAKVVFIADAVEPSRKHDAAETARDMLQRAEPIDSIMLYLLDNQIKYVLERGLTLHPESVVARNSLLPKCRS